MTTRKHYLETQGLKLRTWFSLLLDFHLKEEYQPTHFSIYYHTLRPFCEHGLILKSQHGLSNYIHNKMWYEITYPFWNFNGWTVKVWEWISNFTPHFTRHMIIYPGDDHYKQGARSFRRHCCLLFLWNNNTNIQFPFIYTQIGLYVNGICIMKIH